jgi:hypothetical protein
MTCTTAEYSHRQFMVQCTSRLTGQDSASPRAPTMPVMMPLQILTGLPAHAAAAAAFRGRDVLTA